MFSSYKDYELSAIEYYCFAIMELYIFTGMNGNFNQIGIFGLHEIINRKKLKGIIFMISGNICLFLKYKFQGLGDIAVMIYTILALVDILLDKKRRNRHYID